MSSDSSYLRVARPQDIQNPAQRRIFRAFEMLPGVLAWSTFLLLVAASRFWPEQTSLALIAFIIFWFLRTLYFLAHLIAGYRQTQEYQRVDWQRKLELLVFPRPALPSLDSWQNLWHLVILPTVDEPYEILRDSIRALQYSGWPRERLIVVVAFEEHAGEIAQANAAAVEAEFNNVFGHLLTTFHPDHIPGELRGKGANESWAARQAQKLIIDQNNIPYEHVVASVFDCDTRAERQFFHCLAYHYLTCDAPLRSSFQPIPLYTNNIWHAPALAYILSFSATFWQMIQQARPEALITYSSHSMGFKPLTEVGFWQENVVSEDSRIFYQCLLRFDGNWQVVPLHFFVTMDANIAPTFWQTMKNQYRQQRRWAYGAENIPYLLFGFLKNKKIPFRVKWRYGFHIIEGFHSWATHPLILFVLGWLPLWLGARSFTFTVLSYNLPQIASAFMNFSLIGVAGSMYLSVVLMPQRETPLSWKEKILLPLRWILGPLTILISTIPALDAETRLMLGKYMGFWVTPKLRNPHKTKNK